MDGCRGRGLARSDQQLCHRARRKPGGRLIGPHLLAADGPEHGRRGFAVVGFKFETMPDMEDPLQFGKEIGVHYPLAVATDDLQQKFGGIEGLPTTMLYDRRGVLRTKVIGFEYTDTFESALKPLL